MGSTFTIALALIAVSGDTGTPQQSPSVTGINFAIPTPKVSQKSGRARVVPLAYGGRTIILDEEDLPASTATTDSHADSASCGCGESSCSDCTAGQRRHRRWSWRGCCEPLPGFRRSTGDMMFHVPYIAEPKNYYYFRPYNSIHLPLLQEEVMQYGGDPANPVDNRIFEKVYKSVEDKLSGN